MIYVGTAFNTAYYPVQKQYQYLKKAVTFLEKGNVKIFCILLDCEDEIVHEVRKQFPSIILISASTNDIDIIDRSVNSCLQHGAFLRFLNPIIPLKDNDSIIFTDVDIKIQRAFSTDELDLLYHIAERNSILIGYASNAFLGDDVNLPGLRVPIKEVTDYFSESIYRYPHYHTGVIGTTYSVWKRLHAVYLQHVGYLDRYFSHYGKQEWLISWILSEEGFDVYPPTGTYDLIGHNFFVDYMSDARMDRDEFGTWRRRDSTPVVFAHQVLHKEGR
jgi:hypothetical protein